MSRPAGLPGTPSPTIDVVIDTVEQAQILGKQRPDVREAFSRVHSSVQPREIVAGHDEISKDLAIVAAAQRPSAGPMIIHEIDIIDSGRSLSM